MAAVSSAVSPREAEVLDLLGEHLTHAEIANRLFLSVRTVESHVASLRRKLDLPGHRDLVRYAVARRTAPRALTIDPGPLTGFVGRERELAELRDAMDASRLVSIVGTGGAGKTRLARAMLERVDSPAWLVDLVPVTESAGVAAAVADATGLADQPGVDSETALIRGLGGRPTVLLLDNAEHVANAVAVLVERLLDRCPGLRVVVTSRARLAVPFERVLLLGGLSGDDADALFRQRARAAGFVHLAVDDGRVRAVCERLGGLALAIELAAVRLPSLGLDGVERGLLHQGRLLTGGARSAARHRSIRDTLDWSRQLLTPREQLVLSRLAVFASGFHLSAAAQVAGYGAVEPADVPEAVAALTDQSLLSIEPGRDRWRMLEPVRQFALEGVPPTDRSLAMHARWTTRMAGSLVAASRLGGTTWYDAFDDVVDELRAALGWLAGPARRRGEAAGLAHDLALVLLRAGRLRESQARYEQEGELAGTPEAFYRAITAAAAVAKCRDLGDQALRLELVGLDAVRLARPDLVAEAAALAAETILRFEGMFADYPGRGRADELLAEAHVASPGRPELLATARVLRTSQIDPTGDDCVAIGDRAITRARAAGDVVRESAVLDVLTAVHVTSGRPVMAAELARRRLDLLLRRPLEPAIALELKDALHMAVLACVGAGDLDSALTFGAVHETLPFLREQRDLGIEDALLPLVLAGRWADVRPRAASWLVAWTDAGRPAGAGRAIAAHGVALMHGLRGAHDEEEEWLGIVGELRGVPRPLATRGSGFGELFDATIALRQGRPERARVMLDDRGVPRSVWYGPLFCQWEAALAAEAAVLAGAPDALDRCRAAESAAAGNPVASLLAARAACLASGELDRLPDLAAQLDAAAAGYEAARTRVLAGGRWLAEGEARIAALAECGP